MFSGPSLGWAVLQHTHDYLPSPQDITKPLTFTDEQAEFILRWYALNDDGEFLYRRADIEMAKGWGKSPLVAALCFEELVGPVTFERWGPFHEPIGKPWRNPWIQIAAVSEDQTDNTYSALYDMLVANDHQSAKRSGIDDGRTRLYVPGGRLEPVTAAAGSREGQRITAAVLDETWLWTRRNGGQKLAGTLRRNLAKMGGRSIETTNAPLLGEKSVAEQSGLDLGVLHLAKRPPKEPSPDWTDEQLLAALSEAYGQSYWVPQRRLLAEMRDPETDWSDVVRFYFNVRTPGTGRAVDARRWEDLRETQVVPAGTYIGLGFDGSVSRDSTWLIGCTQTGFSFVIGKWIRPPGVKEWRVDHGEVDDAVDKAFNTYQVGLMLCDPPFWQEDISRWAKRYGSEVVLQFETNQPTRMAMAVDRWLAAIREGTHHHDGDIELAEHVRQAHKKRVRLEDDPTDGRTKYVLIKGDEHQLIDGAVTDVLALQAAKTMPEEPLPLEPLFAFGS